MQVPTGYQLVTRMYGTHVSYVTRAEYADRAAMFDRRVEQVRQQDAAAKVRPKAWLLPVCVP